PNLATGKQHQYACGLDAWGLPIVPGHANELPAGRTRARPAPHLAVSLIRHAPQEYRIQVSRGSRLAERDPAQMLGGDQRGAGLARADAPAILTLGGAGEVLDGVGQRHALFAELGQPLQAEGRRTALLA